jgi:ParB family transcriptional regulator, chromosome partitioning protein
MVLKQIRCTDIRADWNPGQEQSGIEELVASIRRHGVLRPVLLRPTEGGYVIVHGERRWRAARALGLEVIPAFLVEESPREQFATH